jgi:TRAP-type C4-dicarboxylate transport system permease small subunit
MGLGKLIKGFVVVFDRVIDVCVGIGAYLIALMALLITANVILRYVFGMSQGWVIEVTPWILAYVVLLGASRVLQNGGHVNVEIIIMRQTVKTKVLVGVITSIIAALCCLIITWFGAIVTLDLARNGTLTMESVRIPKSIVMAFIPMGFFFLFVEFIRVTYKYLTGKIVAPAKEEVIL